MKNEWKYYEKNSYLKFFMKARVQKIFDVRDDESILHSLSFRGIL